jgi:hypothetical protein
MVRQMMGFWRLHWADAGMVLALVVGAGVVLGHPNGLALVLWLSLVTLFVHQFEEYRYPGYFPGMMNTAMYGSDQPDRYPLNSQTAMVVNVCLGWGAYLLAAVFHVHAIWLGIATILVSVGNVVAHGVLFNVRGRTRYNPGMVTALVLFLPLATYFFVSAIQQGAASPMDWVVGVALGVALNLVGVLKTIDWMKDVNTPYVFPPRFLAPSQRGQVVPAEV